MKMDIGLSGSKDAFFKNFNYEKRYDSTSLYNEEDLKKQVLQDFNVIQKDLGFTKAIPILPSNRLNLGDNTYTYRFIDKVGKANITSEMADDVPIVGRSAVSVEKTMVWLTGSYITNFYEEQNASSARVNIDTLKTEAVARAFAEAHNKLFFYGEPTYNINGWLKPPAVADNDFISSYKEVAADENGERTWLLKTPQGIFNDVSEARMEGVKYGTNKLPMNRLAMCPVTEQILKTKLFTNAAGQTVAPLINYIQQCFPELEFVVLEEMRDGFRDGKTGFIMYRFDTNTFGGVAPEIMAMYPGLQKVNFVSKTLFYGRNGGVYVINPKSQVFRYGI